MKYTITYTAVYEVEADSPESAIESAIDSHEDTPNGDWVAEVECPRNDGGLDCTPFCPSCEGSQLVTVSAGA